MELINEDLAAGMSLIQAMFCLSTMTLFAFIGVMVTKGTEVIY